MLTLHIPSGSDTAGVVDAEVIAALPDGATLINTSRGDVVDEAALLAALDAGRLWAGLDVYVDEPSSGQATWTSPLAAHPRVVGTHHIGASTEQAQKAVAEGVVEVVEAYADRHAAQRGQPAGRRFVTAVRPFAARVVKQDWAARVVCPMHDAIPVVARAQYLADNPWSYLHVMRSKQDLPESTQIEIGQTNAGSAASTARCGRLR